LYNYPSGLLLPELSKNLGKRELKIGTYLRQAGPLFVAVMAKSGGLSLVVETKKAPGYRALGERRDSNPRPPESQSGVLTN
jgi:hypothetical protein